MEYLFDIITIAIAVLLVIIFAARGFIKSMFRFLRWMFSALMAYFFGNRVATIFYDKVFYNNILKSVTEKVQAAYDSATSGFSGETIYERLPFFLKTASMKEKLTAIENGDEMVANISETVSKPIARLASNIAGYLSVFIVAFLLFLILTLILNKVVKISKATKFINGFLGALLGLSLAFFLIIMAVSVVKIFFADTPVGQHSILVRWLGIQTF